MAVWIVLEYNKPLMTRKELLTGKNVSLLCFIRSRFDMRRIFDSDYDSEGSNSECSDARTLIDQDEEPDC